MESIEFAKHRLLFDKVVFIDGTAHVGKMMLGPILSTYRGVEMQKLETLFEHVAILRHYGKISLDAAVTLMREHLDESLYNLMIGRNVNMRPTDLSSVFQGANQQRYLLRLFGGEGETTARQIAAERPVYQNLSHEILGFADPLFAAFGERFYIVEVLRHPGDLVNCWLKRGWGGARLHEDPRAFILTFDHAGTQLPYYAHAFKDRYLGMEDAERVVHCIHSCNAQIMDGYGRLPAAHQARVMFAKFESLVTDTRTELARLASFLGLEEGPALEAVVAEQRCPRSLDPDARDRQTREFMKNAPASAHALLEEMVDQYDRIDPYRP